MSLSRRELVSLLLGTPLLAAVGCKSSSGRLPAEGRLFGQSFDVGHRIRDGQIDTNSSNEQTEEIPIVIVGGGVAGLSAGWKLQKAGYSDFVLLELEDVVGGTSRSGRCELTEFPWGAHYLPVPLPHNQDLIGLLKELELVESIDDQGHPKIFEQYLCREPEERLFIQGKWIEGLYPSTDATQQDLDEWHSFHQEIDRWVTWRDSEGRRAFAIPTAFSSDDPVVRSLDQITMSDWLTDRGFQSERLRWVVDYSCRDDYGLSANETSAWAGILYFAARMFNAGSEPQPYITSPSGNGRFVEYFRERLNSKIRTGAAVIRIEHTESNSNSIVTWFDVATNSVRKTRADYVVFAAPQFVGARLIDGFTDRFHRDSTQFQYGSWLTANVFLKDRPKESGFPFAWDNVFYDSQSLGYVVATHQQGSDYGPTVLTWYLPYCESDIRRVREVLLKASWEELADVVLVDLERAHPEIRQMTTRLDLFRWGHAMIQPRPGFVSSAQRRDAIKTAGRIHFANTDLSGIALFEEAFYHGCRAAEEIRNRLIRKT